MTERLEIEEILNGRTRPAGGATVLGRSRRGRPIVGWAFGSGARRASLIGGAHPDEPVGPEMLRRLVRWIGTRPPSHPVLALWSWWIVPHVNPDGAAVNAGWPTRTVPMRDSVGEPDRGYLFSAHFESAVRERPGDDLEFGFPWGADDRDARPEACAVAEFLAAGAPLDLHGSFHSMAFGAGPWFLLDRAWIARTARLRERLAELVHRTGYRLHDVDRRGEKGFTRIAEGFCTRPDSEAMRRHFEGRDDGETAALFRPSSMETVRSMGGDPLTVVSEMPLFLVEGVRAGRSDRDRPPVPLDPHARHQFSAWASAIHRDEGAAALDRRVRDVGIRAMPMRDQMRLQLALLQEAITAVEDHAPGSHAERRAR